jgi:hypothetical protein
MVPVIAQLAEIPRHHADAGVEHEEPQHPGHRRRHGVGPDQQGAIGARALDQPVSQHRQNSAGTIETTVTRVEKTAVVTKEPR